MSNDEVQAERVAWIKRMRKGQGLATKREDVPLSLFGAESWEELVANLTDAHLLMASSRARAAIGLALNVHTPSAVIPDLPGANLSQRRENALRGVSSGQSLRTLMRDEERGAELLAESLDRLLEPWSYVDVVGSAITRLEIALRRADTAKLYEPDAVRRALKILDSGKSQPRRTDV